MFKWGVQAKLDQTIQIQKSLKETGEAILLTAEQNKEYQQLKDQVAGLQARTDEAVMDLQQLADLGDEILSKADQALSGQQELKNKTKQALSGQQELKKKTEQALSGQQELKKKVDQSVEAQHELEKKVASALDGVQQLKSDLQQVLQSMEQIRRSAIDSSRYAAEAVWGELFNQVSEGSSWLKDRRFAAGRAAVGYQYLYVAYRILNEIKPKSILDLGLGQSTKLISQYAASHPDVRHQVVEHDPEWMDFFRRNYKLTKQTEMVQLDREFISYKEAENVRVFKNFSETFKGQKFDFISIDAPLGVDMKQYSRIDVLKILPGCLADSFIIIIDDAERSGESHTIREMGNVLKASHIAFVMGRYSGKKDCVVICSENLRFACTM